MLGLSLAISGELILRVLILGERDSLTSLPWILCHPDLLGFKGAMVAIWLHIGKLLVHGACMYVCMNVYLQKLSKQDECNSNASISYMGYRSSLAVV